MFLLQSLLKTAEHLKIKGLCEVNDQCDNPLEYFNYNPRQAHTQQYLSSTSTSIASRHPSLIPTGHHHSKSSSQNRFGESSNKRPHGTPTKGRAKSPRLTPETAKGDGQLISSDTETSGEQGQRERGREKGKMASLGMGMVSDEVLLHHICEVLS